MLTRGKFASQQWSRWSDNLQVGSLPDSMCVPTVITEHLLDFYLPGNGSICIVESCVFSHYATLQESETNYNDF